jgi:hypothetical protein
MAIICALMIVAGIGAFIFSGEFPDPDAAKVLGCIAPVVAITAFLLFHTPAKSKIPKKIWICPICANEGKLLKKSKGSVLVCFALLCLWLLPGLLYLMFRNGYVLVCSSCGAKLAER